MLYTAAMTDTHTTLQADRATWERLLGTLGRGVREASQIRAAIERAATPAAVRVTVPHETAALWRERVGGAA